MVLPNGYSAANSRARSTKTRIETVFWKDCPATIDYIREQDPLKQGLKLGSKQRLKSSLGIREQDPLKQGLKHKLARVGILQHDNIREQDPLKQGLKR